MGPSISVDGERLRPYKRPSTARASMGPSISVDGEVHPCTYGASTSVASMGPSISVDGETLVMRSGVSPDGASMGPSISVDGERLSHPLVTVLSRLQWGRRSASTERSPIPKRRFGTDDASM